MGMMVSVARDEERPFYTVESLARRLALSERTVRDILSRGELPYYQIGRQRRIDPIDVEKWLQRQRPDE